MHPLPTPVQHAATITTTANADNQLSSIATAMSISRDTTSTDDGGSSSSNHHDPFMMTTNSSNGSRPRPQHEQYLIQQSQQQHNGQYNHNLQQFHLQLQEQQQNRSPHSHSSSSTPHPIQYFHTNTNTNNNHLVQMSPTFHNRSSPIAIIQNPEDEQAKVRWQHPMYDTSDDEMDDNDVVNEMNDHDSYGGPFSSSTITSTNPRTTRNTSSNSHHPKSLPTALLRAPKLGSLPSQDYRLHHLATLPPPFMCLNNNSNNSAYYDGGDDDDDDDEAGGNNDTDIDSAPCARSASLYNNSNNDGLTSQSRTRKPRYLSSYGSLRESHLTGRFGGSGGGNNFNLNPCYNNNNAPATAASTGHLHIAENRKVRFQQSNNNNNNEYYQEPPATLLPPASSKRRPLPPPSSSVNKSMSVLSKTQRQPESKTTTTSPTTMSIRDRMMQKVQQQQQHHQQQQAEKEAATKSLSSIPSSSSYTDIDTNSNNNNSSNEPNKTKKATSSLAAMLEASEQQAQKSKSGSDTGCGENNNINRTAIHSQHQQLQSSIQQSVLPPSMAQAVAISYNSNLALFANTQRQREAEREQLLLQQQQLEGEVDEFNSNSNNHNNRMLSSSMTGLEILRAASKATTCPIRPTSLSILQDSSRYHNHHRQLSSTSSSLSMMSSPPAAIISNTERKKYNDTINNDIPEKSNRVDASSKRIFPPLARTMSDPSPHWSSQHRQQRKQQQQQFHPHLDNNTNNNNYNNSSSNASRQEAQYLPAGIIHTRDGRTVIPPRTVIGQPLTQEQARITTTDTATGLSGLMAEHHRQQEGSHQNALAYDNSTLQSFHTNALLQSNPSNETMIYGGNTMLSRDAWTGSATGSQEMYAGTGTTENPDTEETFEMDLE